MKKLIVILFFCFIAATPCFSQTKQESIKELFKVMQFDSMYDKMFEALIPTLTSSYEKSDQSQSEKDATDEKMRALFKIVKDMSKKMTSTDMVELYDKYFTKEEIEDFIKFYKSPSGQKFLKVTPDIQKELMTIMMQKYMPEMKKSIEEMSK